MVSGLSRTYSSDTHQPIMTSMPPRKYTIPTFLSLAFAGFYFIVLHMALSKAPARFLEVHKASQVPLCVTNIGFLDKILTPLVSFFVAAFGDANSPSYPTVVDFVWSFGAAIQLPLIEAQRNGLAPKSFLAYPMIWGILYQRVSGGWILPLWLLAFMHSKTRADGEGVERVKAQSVLFGWWAGHTLPALAMLVPGQPAFTKAPIWIAFPILMTVAQRAYLLVAHLVAPRPSRQSGYIALQFTYFSVFIASCMAHVHLVVIPGLGAAPSPSPLSTHLAALAHHLWTFFIPPMGLRTPSVESTTAASGVRHFVQWDVLIVFTAVWIAGIWDLVLRRRDAQKQLAQANTGSRTTSAWFVAKTLAMLFPAALALGPGAATAALWAYRETVLEKARSEAKVVSDVSERTSLLNGRSPRFN